MIAVKVLSPNNRAEVWVTLNHKEERFADIVVTGQDASITQVVEVADARGDPQLEDVPMPQTASSTSTSAAGSTTPTRKAMPKAKGTTTTNT